MKTLPETMTSIEITGPGGPEVLEPRATPVPRPASGEILVRVEAAGVNRPDVMQRTGSYPPPPGAPATPGLEISGEIVARGPDTERFDDGARIVALVGGGGYAEYCVACESHALRIPEGLDAVEAAALPETFFTVWSNVFDRGGLKAGETLLVHGGASGIGTTAIQLAREFGATVYVTAGSADKCRRCAELGAARAINYVEEDFVSAVKESTGGKGVDLILDMIAGDYVDRNYSAAATDGRIVQIAIQHGAKAEIDIWKMMRKRLTHTGSTLRPRSVEDKATIRMSLEEHVWPLIDAGRIRPIIDRTFPLTEAAAAHAHMEAGRHFGKIVLTTG